MKITSKIGLLVLLLSGISYANQSFLVKCDVSGQAVVTVGVSSTTKVEQTLPGCTVSVFPHGSASLAAIFSDNSGTVLANPFNTPTTGLTPGQQIVYAANGRYDFVLSGTGIPNPITISDVLLNDPASPLGCTAIPALTGDVTSAGGTCATTLPSIATAGTGLKTTINVKGQATAVTTAASSDLSDSANIAKLNVNNNFGANSITAGPITGTTGTYSGAVTAASETVSGEIAPDITGRAVGDASHRWDAFLRNLDNSGTGIFGGNVTVPSLTNNGSETITGNATVGGTLGVTGAVTVGSAANNLGSITSSDSGIYSNTQENEFFQSLLNSCVPGTEWTNIGQSGFTTNAISGCNAVPAAAAVVQATGLSGWVNNLSTTVNAVGVYGQARALVNGAHIWGMNPIASDAGFAANMQGLEVDCNVSNVSTVGQCINVNGNFSAQPTGDNFPFIRVFKPGANQFTTGISFKDGAVVGAGVSLAVQTTGNNQFSQLISFTGRDSGGVTHSASAVASPSGDMRFQPGTGVAFFGVNSGALNIVEAAAPSGAGTVDILYADSTAHRWKMNNNNGGADTVVGAATTDTLSNKSTSAGPVTGTVGSGTVTTAGTGINTLTCQAQTGITITGATATDVATCSLNAALPATWQTGIFLAVPVVTSNTVTVSLCNPTATATITPAAAVVRCTVTR